MENYKIGGQNTSNSCFIQICGFSQVSTLFFAVVRGLPTSPNPMVSHQLHWEKGQNLGYHVWTVPEMLWIVKPKTQIPILSFFCMVYPMALWLVNVVFPSMSDHFKTSQLTNAQEWSCRSSEPLQSGLRRCGSQWYGREHWKKWLGFNVVYMVFDGFSMFFKGFQWFVQWFLLIFSCFLNGLYTSQHHFVHRPMSSTSLRRHGIIWRHWEFWRMVWDRMVNCNARNSGVINLTMASFKWIFRILGLIVFFLLKQVSSLNVLTNLITIRGPTSSRTQVERRFNHYRSWGGPPMWQYRHKPSPISVSTGTKSSPKGWFVQEDGVLVAVNPRNATVLQEQGRGPGKQRPFK